MNGLRPTVCIQKLKRCKVPLAAKEGPFKSNCETKLTFQERYCLCNEPNNRAMLKCNKICLIKWFYLDCVSLRAHPKGSWFCSTRKSTLSVKHVLLESEKLISNWTILPLCWLNCSFLQIVCNIVILPNNFFSVIYLFFVPRTSLQFVWELLLFTFTSNVKDNYCTEKYKICTNFVHLST